MELWGVFLLGVEKCATRDCAIYMTTFYITLRYNTCTDATKILRIVAGHTIGRKGRIIQIILHARSAITVLLVHFPLQHDIITFNQRSQLQSCGPIDRHEHRSSNVLSARTVRVICGLLREPNRQAEECLGVALRGGE